MAQEKLDLDTPSAAFSRAQAGAQLHLLRRLLQGHNHLYYVEAKPEISDGEYDILYRRLLSIETAYPELVTLDSPSQRVGAEPREDIPTLPHTAPMLSLDSSKEEEDLIRFDERIRKAIEGPIKYLVEQAVVNFVDTGVFNNQLTIHHQREQLAKVEQKVDVFGLRFRRSRNRQQHF